MLTQPQQKHRNFKQNGHFLSTCAPKPPSISPLPSLSLPARVSHDSHAMNVRRVSQGMHVLVCVMHCVLLVLLLWYIILASLFWRLCLALFSLSVLLLTIVRSVFCFSSFQVYRLFCLCLFFMSFSSFTFLLPYFFPFSFFFLSHFPLTSYSHFSS